MRIFSRTVGPILLMGPTNNEILGNVAVLFDVEKMYKDKKMHIFILLW